VRSHTVRNTRRLYCKQSGTSQRPCTVRNNPSPYCTLSEVFATLLAVRRLEPEAAGGHALVEILTVYTVQYVGCFVVVCCAEVCPPSLQRSFTLVEIILLLLVNWLKSDFAGFLKGKKKEKGKEESRAKKGGRKEKGGRLKRVGKRKKGKEERARKKG
jgi:hypothetical protein